MVRGRKSKFEGSKDEFVTSIIREVNSPDEERVPARQLEKVNKVMLKVSLSTVVGLLRSVGLL